MAKSSALDVLNEELEAAEKSMYKLELHTRFLAREVLTDKKAEEQLGRMQAQEKMAHKMVDFLNEVKQEYEKNKAG